MKFGFGNEFSFVIGFLFGINVGIGNVLKLAFSFGLGSGIINSESIKGFLFVLFISVFGFSLFGLGFFSRLAGVLDVAGI